jgi:hypothetical protein
MERAAARTKFKRSKEKIMKLKITVILMVYIALLTTMPMLVRAQSAGKPTTAPSASKEEDAPVLTRGLKTKILEVKHRDPESLLGILAGLRSGDRYSQINASNEYKTITVRDFPENIIVIEKALVKLDQPERAPVNLEVQLHLITASRTSTEKSVLPAGLEPVIAQLQSTFQYSGYRFITTFFNRVVDGGNIVATGNTDTPFQVPGNVRKTNYQYDLKRVKLISDESGKEAIQIRHFNFEIQTLSTTESFGTKITSDLSLREGEIVVVGTANVGNANEAIIVAITVKKAK